MSFNIWVSSDKAEHRDIIYDCQCDDGKCYPHESDTYSDPQESWVCEECNGDGRIVINSQVNSYGFGVNVPQWLRDATSRYYSQLTHNQCNSLAFEIQERIDNGETMMFHGIGDDELTDKLPMLRDMFKALAKEAKALDCLVYMG